MKMKMNVNDKLAWIARHGDVQLIRVNSLPKDAKTLGQRKELAFGEVTGHAHRVDLGELFETKEGKLYLKVDQLDRLDHEEHLAKPLESGIYFVGIKRQYTPSGWESVRD